MTVAACVVVPGPGGVPGKAVRTFGTMTADLLALGDWLAAQGVTHVAMESTGVYWKPVWNLLEERFTLLLVNARHVKAVPGRKTDVRDGEWLADLLRHGLLRASFVPDRPQRELRELTRDRTGLVQERAAEINRLQKTLEGANIKLPGWRPTSWACRRVGCSRRWWRAPRTRRPWPSWPRAGSGRRSRSCSARWSGGSGPTNASWSPSN
jgi:hypothetical protein